MDKEKVVLLDRDGTLNEDKDGYIDHPDKFKLFPGVAVSLKKLNVAGFKVIVITNQSGLARGYYTWDELELVHKEMKRQLQKVEAFIDEILISPYHRDGVIEPYNKDHQDRKPGLGLWKKARAKYNIETKNSFMIGDKYSDVEFGEKAGLKTILVMTGHGRDEFMQNRKNWKLLPDLVVKDFSVAVEVILKLGERI